MHPAGDLHFVDPSRAAQTTFEQGADREVLESPGAAARGDGLVRGQLAVDH